MHEKITLNISDEEKKIFRKLLKEGKITYNHENECYATWIKKEIRSNLSIKQLIDTNKSTFHKRVNNHKLIKSNIEEPLTVRHGSMAKFSEFTENSNGIYFCNYENACKYAYDKLELLYGGYTSEKIGISLVEAFIKGSNIIEINREKYRNIDVREYREKGYDLIIARNTRDSAGIYDQYIVKESNQIYIINNH